MKSYERITSFSTEVHAETTILEIERMLAIKGASKIMKDYDGKGNPVGLAFMIRVKGGEMPVKMPISVEGIKHVFQKQVSNGKLPRKFWGTDFADAQALRVGWRILKSWLEAQLALLEIEMVKIEEIFLPYMWDGKQTMFERLESRNFTLALEDRRKPGFERPEGREIKDGDFVSRPFNKDDEPEG